MAFARTGSESGISQSKGTRPRFGGLLQSSSYHRNNCSMPYLQDPKRLTVAHHFGPGADLWPMGCHGSAPERKHGSVGRIDDPVDQRRQRLEGMPHFVGIGMSGIRRSDAWQCMAKAALGDVGIDAGTAQQASAAATEIVNSPIHDTGGGIELCFRLRE